MPRLLKTTSGLRPTKPKKRTHNMFLVRHSTTEPLQSQRGSNVFFSKTIIFQGSRGGPTFYGGGGQIFPGGGGGIQMLISIENYRNWDFQGRGSGPPIPPLDPRMFCLHL